LVPTLSPADTHFLAARAGRPVVVKLGGSAMEHRPTTLATLGAVAALAGAGLKLALVHGGGKPIDRAMAAAGLTPVKIQGRRFTDDATLAIVAAVLAELNAGLERDLRDLGCDVVGFRDFSGYPAFPLAGERLLLPGLDLNPVDLGRVGFVTTVDRDAILSSAGGGVPVLPSLCVSSAEGGMLNVNADTVAAAVAKALGAETVVFLTDTPGVLRDVADPGSLLTELTRGECEQLMRDGVIAGGMVPKVEACFDALDAGATRAVILDGRDPLSLVNDCLGRPAGTAIRA
jgi:acetylglutamate kinase